MAEKLREQPIEQKIVPTIRREQREIHSPLDTLGRSSENLRIPAEQTRPGGPRAIAKSDRDMVVAKNVSELRLEGSSPIQERFLRLLESLRV